MHTSGWTFKTQRSPTPANPRKKVPVPRLGMSSVSSHPAPEDCSCHRINQLRGELPRNGRRTGRKTPRGLNFRRALFDWGSGTRKGLHLVRLSSGSKNRWDFDERTGTDASASSRRAATEINIHLVYLRKGTERGGTSETAVRAGPADNRVIHLRFISPMHYPYNCVNNRVRNLHTSSYVSLSVRK